MARPTIIDMNPVELEYYPFNIDFDNINLDNNFDEDDPGTIIDVKLLDWYIKFEMSVAWHPNRWWDLCVSEDEKKEIDPIIEEL